MSVRYFQRSDSAECSDKGRRKYRRGGMDRLLPFAARSDREREHNQALRHRFLDAVPAEATNRNIEFNQPT